MLQTIYDLKSLNISLVKMFYLSIFLFVFLSFVYYLFVCLSTNFIFIHLFAGLITQTTQFIYIHIHLSIYLFYMSLSIHPHIYVSMYVQDINNYANHVFYADSCAIRVKTKETDNGEWRQTIFPIVYLSLYICISIYLYCHIPNISILSSFKYISIFLFYLSVHQCM